MALSVAEKGQIHVMGHVIADYPSPKEARQMIDVMVKAGVLVIEIQIPFSEPMADGPLFMQANQAALEHGVRVSDCFILMEEVSKMYPAVTFLFMTYANIIFKLGFSEFVERAVGAGAKGIITPDLPIDAAEEFEKACQAQNFMNILVLPPNISDERLAQLCQKAQGMIYAVARKGVTGNRTEFGKDLDDFLKRVKAHTKLPIAVGFGVKNAEDVAFLKGRADYAVIGSRGLEIFISQGVKGAAEFWRSLT